jgi:uncharacterized protein (TIGR02145 family)
MMKCIAPATYTLIASALDFCESSEGVTFALSGTESGRDYQLYRDNSAVDDAVLNGTGSAETFTGSFDEAGTYSALSIADELYCAIAMSGSHVVIEHPLPDNPVVTGDSRNCPGTVTLSASSPGAVIDWYTDIAAPSATHTGASYTTPEIATSTTYYVQARVENTGCLSARVPVVAEVNMEGCCDAPGATVDFTAFTPCTSPTPAAGSTWTLRDTRAGGNNNTYIVKKMADGRIWMVQDLLFGNCAASPAPWREDVAAGDPNIQPTVYTDATSTYVGHCRAATVTASNKTVYYYNWAGTMNNANGYYSSSDNSFACTGTSSGSSTPKAPSLCRGICPVGWHVPTGDANGEYPALYKALGGTGTSSNATLLKQNFGFASNAVSYDNHSQHWHATIAGIWWHGSLDYSGDYAYYNSSSAANSEFNHGLMYYNPYVQTTYVHDWGKKQWGFPVRCLRNY